MKLHKIVSSVILTLATIITVNVSAQVEEIITTIDHRFSESIRFQAQIQSDIPVSAAVLYFQVAGEERTNMGLAKITRSGENQYQAEYEHDAADYPIAPFSEISAHWELFLLDGKVIKSQTANYPYIDNRYTWKSHIKSAIQIHWNSEDDRLGELLDPILDSAESAIQEVFPGSKLRNVSIYIYTDEDSLPAIPETSAGSWAARMSNLESGVILMALPDITEQLSSAEQRIPQELMRLQLYRYTSGDITRLPAWLSDGLVLAAANFVNPDYAKILSKSSQSDELIPFHSLCAGFPTEPDKAALSNAQAQSFVRYLQNTFGATGVKQLIDAYSENQDCETGFLKGTGSSLSQIEREWKNGQSANQINKKYESLVPWAILALAVLTAPLIVIVGTVFRSKKTDQLHR